MLWRLVPRKRRARLVPLRGYAYDVECSGDMVIDEVTHDDRGMLVIVLIPAKDYETKCRTNS